MQFQAFPSPFRNKVTDRLFHVTSTTHARIRMPFVTCKSGLNQRTDNMDLIRWFNVKLQNKQWPRKNEIIELKAKHVLRYRTKRNQNISSNQCDIIWIKAQKNEYSVSPTILLYVIVTRMNITDSTQTIFILIATKLITRSQCLPKIAMKSKRGHIRQLLNCTWLRNGNRKQTMS